MKSWNYYTEEYFEKITSNLRKKRVELFVNLLDLGPNDKILDLGSEDGSYLGKYYPYKSNIILGDIREEPMKRGVEQYKLGGYRVIPEDGILPFNDEEFDAVWCNSVIEHVTANKGLLENIIQSEFREIAENNQNKFANEIERISKKYFVQTPYIHFPIESHSWLPFLQYMPRKLQWFISKSCKYLWIKKWTPDFLLYNQERMKKHFRCSDEIIFEKVFFLKKSIIALRRK